MKNYTIDNMTMMAIGGEQTETLPGGGFHGGEQTDTLPGGGFHGGEQTETLPGGGFHGGEQTEFFSGDGGTASIGSYKRHRPTRTV